MIELQNIWYRSILIPIVSAIVWQIIRGLWLMIELKEPFLNGFFVRPKVSNKTDRNVVHARLGVIHCVTVILFTSISMYIHRDETWEQWNFQRTPDLDEKSFFQPFWALYVSLGYFLSDIVYISDFPTYYWHHVAAIVESTLLTTDSACSMVTVEGLFVAEVGGILLAVYLQFKTLPMYFTFLLFYAFSRFVLLPLFVYQMIKSSLQPNLTASVGLAWMSNIMSVVLMLINWNFFYTHLNKFIAKVKGRKKDKSHKEETGEDKIKVGARKKAE